MKELIGMDDLTAIKENVDREMKKMINGKVVKVKISIQVITDEYTDEYKVTFPKNSNAAYVFQEKLTGLVQAKLDEMHKANKVDQNDVNDVRFGSFKVMAKAYRAKASNYKDFDHFYYTEITTSGDIKDDTKCCLGVIEDEIIEYLYNLEPEVGNDNIQV